MLVTEHLSESSLLWVLTAAALAIVCMRVAESWLTSARGRRDRALVAELERFRARTSADASTPGPNAAPTPHEDSERTET